MDAFDLDYFELESAEEKLTLPSWEMLKNAVKPQPVTVKSVIPITEKRKNYRITAEDILYPTGAKHKIAANISAIRLLKELEKSGRSATDEECKILIQYCGWGGIPQVFDSGNEKFSKEYAELRNILTSEEYVSARASTLNSHYTPKFLINFIWQIARKAGVRDRKSVV